VLPFAGALVDRLVRALAAAPTPTSQSLRAAWIRHRQRLTERRQSKMRSGLLKSDRQMGDMLSFSGRAE
jgi:hypothetical protein